MHYEGKPHAKKLKMAKEQHKLEALIAVKSSSDPSTVSTNAQTTNSTTPKKVFTIQDIYKEIFYLHSYYYRNERL